MKMPWGKYKGENISDIPDSYLLWLHFSASYSDNTRLKDEAMKEVEIRFIDKLPKIGCNNKNAITKSSLKKIYHQMCVEYHPDRGGNTVAMQAVNSFYQKLNEVI